MGEFKRERERERQKDLNKSQDGDVSLRFRYVRLLLKLWRPRNGTFRALRFAWASIGPAISIDGARVSIIEGIEGLANNTSQPRVNGTKTTYSYINVADQQRKIDKTIKHSSIRFDSRPVVSRLVAAALKLIVIWLMVGASSLTCQNEL